MAISNVVAIKRYFEQVDHIAPEGGRKIFMGELREKGGGLTRADKFELGALAAAELGEEIKSDKYD